MEVFAPWARVVTKRMFGGLGVYREGLFFALVADGTIYLKVDDETRAGYEAAGSGPFVYRGGERPVTMGYWRLPDAAFDDEDALRAYAEAAYHVALRAKAGKSGN